MKGRYNKRAKAHNYRAPFIYHIILFKKEGCEDFGRIMGDARIPYGKPGCAYVEETLLGKMVAKGIVGLHYYYGFLQPFQFKVMPDHAHFILYVTEWTEMELDFYIEELKETIARRYSYHANIEKTKDDIFEESFCDKPLLAGRSLEVWYEYIRLNPHRRAVRMQYPVFFQRLNNLLIAGKSCQAYGNLFHLRNPDKCAVKISGRLSPAEQEAKIEEYIEAARRGSVMVSPFISKPEKRFRETAEAIGAKIIHITYKEFPERFSPAKHEFEMCSRGELLLLSMKLPSPEGLTREVCVRMNALAEEIAGL